MSAEVRSPRGNVHRAASLVLAVVGAGTLVRFLYDAPEWWGWSPAVIATWSEEILWIWLAAAALSAWAVWPVYSRRLKDRMILTIRPRNASALYSVRVVAMWQSVVSVIVLAVGVTWSATSVGIQTIWGVQQFLWVVSCLVIGCFFCLVGAVAAILVKNPVAMLVAPFVSYLIVLLPAYTVNLKSWAELTPYVGQAWDLGVPPIFAVAARCVFWLAVVGALVTLLAGSKKFLMSAVVVAVVSAGFASFIGPDLASSLQASATKCANDHGVQYCAQAPYAAGLSSLAAITRDGMSLLPNTYHPRAIAADTTSAKATGAGSIIVEPVNGVVAPTNRPSRNETLIGLGNALLGLDSCTDKSRGGAAELFLSIWWKIKLGMSVNQAYGYNDAADPTLYSATAMSTATGRANKFANMPSGERTRRLVEYKHAVQTCEATPKELLG